MKKSLFILAILIFLISCSKKEISETPAPTPEPVATTGTITVWTKRTDLGLVTVTCNGQTKYITITNSVSPDCGSGGSANFYNLAFGQYTINVSATGFTSNPQTYTLSNECYKIQIN